METVRLHNVSRVLRVFDIVVLRPRVNMETCSGSLYVGECVIGWLVG